MHPQSFIRQRIAHREIRVALTFAVGFSDPPPISFAPEPGCPELPPRRPVQSPFRWHHLNIVCLFRALTSAGPMVGLQPTPPSPTVPGATTTRFRLNG